MGKKKKKKKEELGPIALSAIISFSYFFRPFQ